jgi:hypothetical protein
MFEYNRASIDAASLRKDSVFQVIRLGIVL